MILDERNEFADNVSIAAAVGTSVIGDVIDTNEGDVTSELYGSEDLYLVIQTGDIEIITAGAAGTLQFKLTSADNAALTTNAVDHYVSAAYVTDDAGANAAEFSANTLILAVQIPRGTYRRYLGLLKVVGTTTITAGSVNAFLTPTPPNWAALPDNVPSLA